jgi:hypothetical protein
LYHQKAATPKEFNRIARFKAPNRFVWTFQLPIYNRYHFDTREELPEFKEIPAVSNPENQENTLI